MTAEQEVRAAWELVHKCDGSYRNYKRGTILVQDRHGHWIDFGSWDSALAFTREHDHKIEEVEEEVEIIGADAVNGALGMGHVYGRVLAKLEAELTTLRKGMKP